jgi:hypothetical protein
MICFGRHEEAGACHCLKLLTEVPLPLTHFWGSVPLEPA